MLSEVVKGFFVVIDKNESFKVFVFSSKFIVLSVYKFVYIGDILSKRIKYGDLKSEVVVIINKLLNCIKSLVIVIKFVVL